MQSRLRVDLQLALTLCVGVAQLPRLTHSSAGLHAHAEDWRAPSAALEALTDGLGLSGRCDIAVVQAQGTGSAAEQRARVVELISRREPFLLRGHARSWAAYRRWSRDYVLREHGDALLGAGVAMQARPALLGSWDTFQGPSRTRIRYAAC